MSMVEGGDYLIDQGNHSLGVLFLYRSGTEFAPVARFAFRHRVLPPALTYWKANCWPSSK
jgi:hypothetical protein